jgi:NADPH:quinone reductase-like Zn-dependent oxidoreductase
MSADVQDEYGLDGRKNHRVVVTRHGGPEVLHMVEEDLPEPGPGEVRVKVLAAGVSAYDLMQRGSGSLPGTRQVPYTPGEDIAGVADKMGDGVTSIEPGQAVAGYPRGGGYAEFVCVAASELVPVPESVDPAQAVCVVTNYLTAEMLLHPTANLQPGERVLVHGAAGGVGSALVELGKQAGMEMYGTASKYNHELVSSLGATPIDYRSEDFVARIRSLTGDGVDAVFDPVGGAGQIWRSYRTLGKGGRLVSFGMAATKKSGVRVIPFSLLAVVLLGLVPDGKQARMSPNLAVFAAENNDWYLDTLAKLLDAVAAGRIDPVVAERVPLTEAARAHELIERGGYAGKVVLVPGA